MVYLHVNLCFLSCLLNVFQVRNLPHHTAVLQGCPLHMQVQRGLLRQHLHVHYGVPQLLGAAMSFVAPLLRQWRSQPRVQEAFKVHLSPGMAICFCHLGQPGFHASALLNQTAPGRGASSTSQWAGEQDAALLGFYDIWVARDTNGSLFLKQPPFVADRTALRRASQGLPFPVRCCWNGLVVLNSAPFLHHGTRVR